MHPAARGAPPRPTTQQTTHKTKKKQQRKEQKEKKEEKTHPNQAQRPCRRPWPPPPLRPVYAFESLSLFKESPIYPSTSQPPLPPRAIPLHSVHSNASDISIGMPALSFNGNQRGDRPSLMPGIR